MNLEVLQKEMIAAMKAKNKSRKDTLSSLISAVKKTAIDEKCKDNITEDLVNRVLLKEKKTVQEMIDTCPAEREDLLNEYKSRMFVINEFAPKMMSEDEVKNAIYDILATVDTSKSNKGMIMKIVMPKLKGKADGKLINKVVDGILSETH